MSQKAFWDNCYFCLNLEALGMPPGADEEWCFSVQPDCPKAGRIQLNPKRVWDYMRADWRCEGRTRALRAHLGIPDGYTAGLGREYPQPPLSHLYEGSPENLGYPMCRFGWNRDEGQSYSIWRGNVGEKGICKICLRRALAGLDGVLPRERRT